MIAPTYPIQSNSVTSSTDNHKTKGHSTLLKDNPKQPTPPWTSTIQGRGLTTGPHREKIRVSHRTHAIKENQGQGTRVR